MEKVLHAITRLDKGGSSANTLLSAAGLAGKGYRVDLLYGMTSNPDETLVEKAKSAGVQFIEERSLLRDIHPLKDLQALFLIYDLLKKKKYDILHAHTSKAGLICRLAGKLTGTKIILYTPHGHVFYGYFGRIKTSMILFVESILARFTTRIIGLTPAECTEWQGFGVGNKDQYVSIPSGIDFNSFVGGGTETCEGVKMFEESADKKIIGSAGRFVEVKGYEFFIEAAISLLKKRNDVIFMLVGGGKLEEKYRKMINNAGYTDKFRIIPWQDDPERMIRMMDIFVLSSINEGMGRVLAEAMFFEKPVIATVVGGVPGLVSDNEGILVPPGSSFHMAEAIETLLDDPCLAEKLGRQAKTKVINTCSCEVMVNELDKLYRKLTEEI